MISLFFIDFKISSLQNKIHDSRSDFVNVFPAKSFKLIYFFGHVIWKNKKRSTLFSLRVTLFLLLSGLIYKLINTNKLRDN